MQPVGEGNRDREADREDRLATPGRWPFQVAPVPLIAESGAPRRHRWAWAGETEGVQPRFHCPPIAQTLQDQTSNREDQTGRTHAVLRGELRIKAVSPLKVFTAS